MGVLRGCWKCSFWATVCKTVATVCKTVRPMRPVCPVCNVGVLWPNDWMDQDKTWHRRRPRPRPHYVRWGSSSPPQKGGTAPIFGPYLLCSSGWVDQDATYGGKPRPRRYCARWGPSYPTERGTASCCFRFMSIVAKRSPISAAAEHLSISSHCLILSCLVSKCNMILLVCCVFCI